MAQPPADLFVPTQREALHSDPDPDPKSGLIPAKPAAGQVVPGEVVPAEVVVPDDVVPDDVVPDDAVPDDAVPDDAVPGQAEPPSVRPDGLLTVAIVAVLLMGLLGVVTIGSIREPAPAATQATPPAAAPPAAAPDPQADDDDTGPFGNEPGILGNDTDPAGIAVDTVEAGTSISLPGPGSRDWAAPGARSDGALVRADLAEESIEFRAANTQPGLSGVFRLSWSGGTPQDERGDATAMLGVRPGGWVAFVVRPLTSPADLVLHLGGNDVAVTVDMGDDTNGDPDGGSSRRVLSAPAAVVTVALPAGTAATVTVAPAGNQFIGVTSAELR